MSSYMTSANLSAVAPEFGSPFLADSRTGCYRPEADMPSALGLARFHYPSGLCLFRQLQGIVEFNA